MLNRANVLEARKLVLDKFSEQGGILEPNKNPDDGILASRCGIGCVPFMEGKSTWTHNDTMLQGISVTYIKRKFLFVIVFVVAFIFTLNFNLQL